MAILRVQKIPTGRPGAEEWAATMTSDSRPGNEPKPRPGLGFEQLPGGVKLERSNGEVIVGDEEIAAVLLSHGLDEMSLEWIQAKEAFTELAFPILVALGTTGGLYEAARRLRVRGLRAIPKRLDLDEENARLLARTMIGLAFRPFRNTSLRRWDPKKGATLSRYFLGCCIQQLVTACRTLWLASDDVTPRQEVLMPPSELPEAIGSTYGQTDPADIVATRLDGRALLASLRSIDPLAARLAELRALGYSLTEALDELGQGDAVKHRLRRWSRKRGREEDF